ncbi:unnamed protein product [Knipowitschia caucasica]|uniref:Fork-head domain-containing protein n=1 Tax=Knipowitschia caucasica TaxID=637954 RepID=A0AAV2K6A1_KNICA
MKMTMRQLPVPPTKQHLRSTTYLAKIALILQGAPDKMLTFSQLMYRMAPLIPEDTKSVEVNIRVCLSSNKCFVKIPLIPGSQNSKKNYWKLDMNHITEKMVRRHFRGILEFFPELASKLQTPIQTSKEKASVGSPETTCKARQVKREVKFTSPFSIESILRRDSAYVRTSRSYTDPFSAEQPEVSHSRGVKRSLHWDTSAAPPVWSVGGSTHVGSSHMRSEGPFPMCSSGPYMTTFSAPILCHHPFTWV